MKSKRLYSSILCYLLMVSITGIICIAATSVKSTQHQKTVVFSGKKTLAADLNLLFEEQNESEQVAHPTFLLLPFSGFDMHLSKVPTNFMCASFISNKSIYISKTPLFINLRTLRL